MSDTNTRYREAIEEIGEKNTKLEKALDEIRMLNGLLSICSHCKKICDDEGNWNRLETYIERRSDAEFSHSICPECLRDHYPDFVLHADSEES